MYESPIYRSNQLIRLWRDKKEQTTQESLQLSFLNSALASIQLTKFFYGFYEIYSDSN